MKVLEVIPVGYQIIVGYSLGDLEHLKTIMDHMVFEINKNDPKHQAANDYLHNKFYPELADTLKELLPNVYNPSDPE